MLVRLHVVIDTEDTGTEEEIKELEKEQAETLRQTLNNDWDGEFDDCDAYGFNTIMFHPHVYYLQFQIQ